MALPTPGSYRAKIEFIGQCQKRDSPSKAKTLEFIQLYAPSFYTPTLALMTADELCGYLLTTVRLHIDLELQTHHPETAAKQQPWRSWLCQKQEGYNFEIKRSLIPHAGWGVFARTDLKKDQKFRYSGKVFVTHKDAVLTPEQEEYALEVPNVKEGEAYILADDPYQSGIGRWMNGGDNPATRDRFSSNAEFVEGWPRKAYPVKASMLTNPKLISIFVMLTRNVKKGEEILVDYGEKYWSELDKEKAKSKVIKRNHEHDRSKGEIKIKTKAKTSRKKTVQPAKAAGPVAEAAAAAEALAEGKRAKPSGSRSTADPSKSDFGFYVGLNKKDIQKMAKDAGIQLSKTVDKVKTVRTRDVLVALLVAHARAKTKVKPSAKTTPPKMLPTKTKSVKHTAPVKHTAAVKHTAPVKHPAPVNVTVEDLDEEDWGQSQAAKKR